MLNRGGGGGILQPSQSKLYNKNENKMGDRVIAYNYADFRVTQLSDFMQYRYVYVDAVLHRLIWVYSVLPRLVATIVFLDFQNSKEKIYARFLNRYVLLFTFIVESLLLRKGQIDKNL
jgi:hypothetical protein